ncbi:glycerophosphoryl diester phosphodiesterase membrane domain-containing protein [Novosphingobium tardum]|uniref:Glycerophosphoryl diester phosphodiesterase membrane domain-containing protein n=1 Tax=Novosphingobium tardum TaxID=1538021 RepID=A0ABV8RNF1_9SPHN
MARLDSNAAWKEATGLVGRSRELMFALAGVFFLLPSLALAVLVGEPELAPGADRDQMMAAMSEFYGRAWWMMLIAAVFQVVGMLAVLTLMRDRTRPTVADAIRSGAGGLLPYMIAQLLFGTLLGILATLLVGLAALASPALAVVVMLAVICFAVFAAIRLILVAPIVAVEGARNPVAAMRRSWALTQGSFWRIFGFFALVLVLFVVIMSVVMIVVGIILGLLTSGETQRILAAAVSSGLSAVAVLYFCGMLAAIHRQLAGTEGPAPGETFA